MDRSERLGLSVSAVAHIGLLAALSLGLLARPRPMPRISDTMDVQLTDAVGLRSTAPVVATEPPAPSVAPTAGPPKDSAPPEPVPAPPEPRPVPPPPAKTAAPLKPAPVADKPAKIKPTPPAASKSLLDSDILKGVKAAAKSEGRSGEAAGKASGARLGKDFLKGIVATGEGKGAAPRAAVGQMAMNGLGAAIKRQVEPCYARKGLVGPGAERIKTVLRLRFNPDGTLSSRPMIAEQTGLDDENGRYAKRAAEVATAAVMECLPLKLPSELYKGGWEDIEPTFSQHAGG